LHGNLDLYSLCQVPAGQGSQKEAMVMSIHSYPAWQCSGFRTVSRRDTRATTPSLAVDGIEAADAPFKCKRATNISLAAIFLVDAMVEGNGDKEYNLCSVLWTDTNYARELGDVCQRGGREAGACAESWCIDTANPKFGLRKVAWSTRKYCLAN
jgi:hypothetical protein